MNKAGGFITLHRQILDWEWFENSETLHLFIFLLLSANYVDGKFQGRLIKRGQLVTSLSKIATSTGLSIRQTRTALEHLISTGEVTSESSSQYRIITIVKYDQYQKATDESTSERQANDNQNDKQSTNEATSNRQQYNNNNNNNKGTNKQGNKGRVFVPPTAIEVAAYQDELQSWWFDSEKFVDYYEAQGWKLKNGQPMRDWKAAVRLWNSNERKRQEEVRHDNDLPY